MPRRCGTTRERLARAGLVEAFFEQFDGHLARQGTIARGGQILDASIVAVPRNRDTREENAAIKRGEEPSGWADEPVKRSQKDTDARWTKKHGRSHYGHKNHVNVDRRHKLVRRYHVSDAALHDSRAVDHLLTRGNTGAGVWADAAYRSEEIEAKLRARGLRSHVHRKGRRGKPLTGQAKVSNRTKSTVCARVEHIFGAQASDMGGTLVRAIGPMRARVKIGMKNLAYNMRRLVQLRRLNPNPAWSGAQASGRRGRTKPRPSGTAHNHAADHPAMPRRAGFSEPPRVCLRPLDLEGRGPWQVREDERPIRQRCESGAFG
jgi:IS5 family transposase